MEHPNSTVAFTLQRSIGPLGEHVSKGFHLKKKFIQVSHYWTFSFRGTRLVCFQDLVYTHAFCAGIIYLGSGVISSFAKTFTLVPSPAQIWLDGDKSDLPKKIVSFPLWE